MTPKKFAALPAAEQRKFLRVHECSVILRRVRKILRVPEGRSITAHARAIMRTRGKQR